MHAKQIAYTPSWSAFELNVLRRLNFSSAILPMTGGASLAAHLKRWRIRVAANDPAQWAYVRNVADVQNNSEQLSRDDLAIILEDAYVPRYKLQNPALKNWFNETDAWWFDNVRQNVAKLASPVLRAVALSIGMQTGDYALSFTEETRELRQPLSSVYQRLAAVYPAPVNNNQENLCTNKIAGEFIAESRADLMFLRLPSVQNANLRDAQNQAWREEWIRANGDFWTEAAARAAGKFGMAVETKSQYLRLFEEALTTAAHIPTWAIAYAEDGFITTQDVLETISRVRPVETIYTKDFSELTGTKAAIIIA